MTLKSTILRRQVFRNEIKQMYSRFVSFHDMKRSVHWYRNDVTVWLLNVEIGVMRRLGMIKVKKEFGTAIRTH